ncbi:MAG TPA: NAD(P)/FAD-dependent oxidoreductase [Candidatus Mailhella merdavium]|nr:NAD(P)/FAD-dependent oxidoreductase [Candidatus Mailhella merdavium]
MNSYDIVIVGGGPAGLTASIYAVRANMKTLVLDKLAPGGQIINTNEIANYTGFGVINGAELAIKMFEHSQEAGAEFEYKTVLAIRDEGAVKKVICEEEGTVYEARAVIIATGTRPRRLGVPGEEAHAGAGISWCAVCDGAQYRGKDVVVIGGGNSAVEESIYLAGIVNKLTVVTMFDLTADPSACDKLRAMPNVTVYPYQDILEFLGTDKLEGVRFKSTKEDAVERTVSCDGVFEYIGLEPTAGFCADLGILDRTGCIVTDAAMCTSRPGIFAAGDIIVKGLRQVATACGDGAIAANSASKYVESLRG